MRHNRAVFRRAEVVRPRHGRTRVGDDVLARSITKVTELHKRNPPYVIHRQGYLRKRFPGQVKILLPFQTLLSVRIVAYFSSSRKEGMHTSETFFPKKRGIDTNPPATKKTSTERKTSPMLVVLAHLARQCANCEQNSLGAPAEAQSYWQGRCPCTLQEECSARVFILFCPYSV